jgi:hypothetical protein
VHLSIIDFESSVFAVHIVIRCGQSRSEFIPECGVGGAGGGGSKISFIFACKNVYTHPCLLACMLKKNIVTWMQADLFTCMHASMHISSMAGQIHLCSRPRREGGGRGGTLKDKIPRGWERPLDGIPGENTQ